MARAGRAAGARDREARRRSRRASGCGSSCGGRGRARLAALARRRAARVPPARGASPPGGGGSTACSQSPEELVDDAEAIGCLEAVGEPGAGQEVASSGRSRFPEQEHKLDAGDEAHDPATGKSAGTIVELDEERRTLRLDADQGSRDVPLPRALVAGRPYDDRVPAGRGDALRRVDPRRQRTLPGARGRFCGASRRGSPAASGRARSRPSIRPRSRRSRARSTRATSSSRARRARARPGAAPRSSSTSSPAGSASASPRRATR